MNSLQRLLTQHLVEVLNQLIFVWRVAVRPYTGLFYSGERLVEPVFTRLLCLGPYLEHQTAIFKNLGAKFLFQNFIMGDTVSAE